KRGIKRELRESRRIESRGEGTPHISGTGEVGRRAGDGQVPRRLAWSVSLDGKVFATARTGSGGPPFLSRRFFAMCATRTRGGAVAAICPKKAGIRRHREKHRVESCAARNVP